MRLLCSLYQTLQMLLHFLTYHSHRPSTSNAGKFASTSAVVMHCLFSESEHLRCFLHGDERMCVAHFVWSIYRQTRRMKRATLENVFWDTGVKRRKIRQYAQMGVTENPSMTQRKSGDKSNQFRLPAWHRCKSFSSLSSSVA